MSKPKAICVMELWLDGCDAAGEFDIEDCTFYSSSDETWEWESKPHRRVYTAPVYLHEWYKHTNEYANKLMQNAMNSDGSFKGDTKSRMSYEAGKRLSQSLLILRWDVLKDTSYDIATNTITTESEGEDE